MDTTFSILVLVGLAAAAIAAARPLLALPRVWPVCQSVLGFGCMAAGTSAFALVIGGWVAVPEFAAAVHAADNKPVEPPAEIDASKEAAEGDSEPAADASPSESAPTEPTEPAPSESAAPVTPALPDDPMIESLPEDTVIFPENRPAWVDSEPKLDGPVHQIAVSSGPFYRHADARRALDEKLVEATGRYINDQAGHELASTFLRYDAQTIKSRFLKSENLYEETIRVSIGPMQQSHALLEFGPEFRTEIEQSWARVRGTSRLTQLGLIAGAGLLLLGSIFGYFRADNATRGYYTGRLQFMTAAAILAVVGAGALLARWITWL